ncbi:MAG TPA: hypothetical protein VNM67_23065 [Thermoanaerobaculia bacterium]|jgi:hypothetical protein|nr:hypothetical protein [Thermoanaerobaculia bacterium]
MEKGKRQQDWLLGEHLLNKGFELAFEDPEMAIRFARLGLCLSALLEGGYDPFSESAKPRRGRRGKGKKNRS